MSTQWWKLQITSENAEELAAAVIGAGIEGSHIISADEFVCYFRGNDERCGEFVELIQNMGGAVLECLPHEERNWVQECQDLWQTTKAGKLRIIPVATSADQLPEDVDVDDATEAKILIIPGTGFGTGHHDTTGQVLLLMQSVEVIERHPARVLDLGAGSGILSLAARSLYECTVDAVEIDSLALENARENIVLNRETATITLSQGGIDAAAGKYNLILANIYAEVLCQLQDEITKRAQVGGLLIVAGILEEKAEQVRTAYAKQWQCLQESRKGEWVAFFFAFS